MVNMPMRDPSWDSTSIGKPFTAPSSKARTPEDIVTLWQWMTVSWMMPLIKTGCQRQLQDEDVWFLGYEFQHSRLHMLFREVTGTVFVRLLKANGLDLIITTVLGVLEMSLDLAEPVLLKQLLGALTAKHPNIRTAIVYATIILFARLAKTQSGVFSLWFSRRNYERSRGEMITMIHEKTLRRKAFTIPSSHELPQEQSMSLNVFLVRLLLRIERARREVTDAKLQKTSQFVESIRHLRWYDWQDAWLGAIMKSRREELRLRVRSNVTMKGIGTVNALAAYLFPVAGFWAYTVVAGKRLTVDVAFPALDLFGMLQNNLRELPDLVTVLLNARVALGRIEKFMLEPEKEDLEDLMGNAGQVGPPTGELKIAVRGASFSWPGSSENEVLRNVEVICHPGLTMVCGKVGIGKTALLQAMLGELDQHGGERTVPREMVGYCAQTPWLESLSIRENILFSAAYDKTRFNQVIDACCLRNDLDQFKSRDLTLIGENGVGLSGGQKARVALARAIYSQARILLLDDPIAALDHHTATTILQKLFGDKSSPLTAGRLIIFVTHRVDIVAPYTYQVLEVTDGGRVETFDKRELENNEDELVHLATIASAAGLEHEDIPDDASSRQEEDPVPDKFMEDEHRAHGGVLASVYWQYIKAGRLRWWIVMVTFFILVRVTKIGYFWFLKGWGEQYRKRPEQFHSSQQLLWLPANSLHTPQGNGSTNKGWLDPGRYLPPPSTDVWPWLISFLVLSVAQVAVFAVADLSQVVIVYKAGKNLFGKAMQRVANATFRFYDVTPAGRLMNRVTSDMGTVDGQIASQLTSVAYYSLGWLFSMLVISTTTPSFLVISIAMTGLFVFVFGRFLPSSQSLRRLETVSLSPLMSNFGALVEGLTTVRAFHAEPYFQNRIIASTDAFQRMDHIYWSLQAWLQYRFDLLSALSTFTLTLTAILSGLSSGTVGFVLASASNFVQSTHSLCRRYGEMQMQFVSVERVIELLSLEQEPRGTVVPPASWPHYGDDIVFNNVTLGYAPTLGPVIHNVTFTIPGGANVAVTGRTGSGKSTLALCLLGTLHPDPGTGGSVRIGGLDLSTVDKHALRRNITFVAQDPVLFPGTLRDNLDPLNSHPESERAHILDLVLSGASGNTTAGAFTLDSRVDGGGKNLSQGQRQLVGLGRAILRRSPVVVMDEATASIDPATAEYIQRLLREELRQSTVITIAHKVEAVQDADWEVVLERGGL
ncbi:hypothetical protein N0V88_002795 [Collariella sp. IMI 366227]|nr:hypothetical protein N0V88_002795 [Collariella sp. IMI 366227]